MSSLTTFPEVSVVIPVYNVDKVLKRCIDSVLQQNDVVKQIILVDDGSTDLSGSICDRYAEQYAEVHTIHKSNKGPSVARNVGIGLSEGEYIFFLDSDDWLNAGILKKMLRVARAHEKPADLVMMAAQKVDAQNGKVTYIGSRFCGEELNGKSGKDALSEILRMDPDFEWYAWRYLYRKDFLNDNALRFAEGRYYEDVEWTPRVFCAAKHVEYVDEVGLNYWFHNSGSILNSPSIKKSIDKIEIAAGACEFAERSFFDQELRDAACMTFSKLYLSGFGDYLNGCREIKELLAKNAWILKYSNQRLAVLLRRLINLIGFSATSGILKGMFALNNRLRRRI